MCRVLIFFPLVVVMVCESNPILVTEFIFPNIVFIRAQISNIAQLINPNCSLLELQIFREAGHFGVDPDNILLCAYTYQFL